MGSSCEGSYNTVFGGGRSKRDVADIEVAG